MPEFPVTDHTRIVRHPERASFDVELAHAIIDEALYCHLGLLRGSRPLVLPTIHARVEDQLYFHGSPASALLKTAGAAPQVCCTITVLDGLVLARSAFHHSMNYRSVVIFGKAREVTDVDEKARALEALVEHVISGRAGDCRAPSEREIAGTMLLALPITEASVKTRHGPPIDAPHDLELEHWAGVLPLALAAGEPIADEHVPAGTTVPDYLRGYERARRR
jgi:nitroimidazol reductase NimA-like FMN-containing flavoprotein (pyridoxamine 5'-phosphate oxidase superfamily)